MLKKGKGKEDCDDVRDSPLSGRPHKHIHDIDRLLNIARSISLSSALFVKEDT
jgi:hypothetical protein